MNRTSGGECRQQSKLLTYSLKLKLSTLANNLLMNKTIKRPTDSTYVVTRRDSRTMLLKKNFF